jgi:hypothetical protein
MNRKIKTIMILVFMTTLLSSCFEDMKVKFDKLVLVEFEDAVRRAPATGVAFPIIAVTRTAGTQSLQVNLVGSQLKAVEEMNVSVDTTIAALLNTNTIRAVEGTHFSLNGGKFVMKQDTSFAAFRFNVQNVTPLAGKSALVVLKLDGGTNIKASENYRRVGFRIALQ